MAKRVKNVISLTDVRLPELREEINELRERLQNVTQIFVENAQNFKIVADIALGIQACNSLAELDHAVGVTMVEQSADHARFYIDEPVLGSIDANFLDNFQSLDESMRKKLAKLDATKCEPCRANVYNALLHIDAQDAASIAMIPASFKSLNGVLVVGSENPNFFANDVGTLYLDFLGATIARTAFRILLEGEGSMDGHELTAETTL